MHQSDFANDLPGPEARFDELHAAITALSPEQRGFFELSYGHNRGDYLISAKPSLRDGVVRTIGYFIRALDARSMPLEASWNSIDQLGDGSLSPQASRALARSGGEGAISIKNQPVAIESTLRLIEQGLANSPDQTEV